MCFTLYIGSQAILPKILWNKEFPQFNTRDLEDYEKNIPACFSYPEVIYAGSDQGCGCGFRHALLQGKEWFSIISEDEQEIDNAGKNHRALFDYITSNLKEGKIELFACWNGDVDGGPKSIEEIKCIDLIDENFYFKEGGFYTISDFTLPVPVQ